MESPSNSPKFQEGHKNSEPFKEFESYFPLNDPDESARFFYDFCRAEEVETVLNTFSQLKNHLNIHDEKKTFEMLHDKFQNHSQIKSLFETLSKKFPTEKCEALDQFKIVVVGAGVAGLRSAIECAFLGCQIAVVEKRHHFGRHNLLHLWDSTIYDIKNIGGKFFYPKFCSGGINHVSIRRIQIIFMKIALILGVRMYSGYSFKGINQPDEHSNEWTVCIESSSETDNVQLFDLPCNSVIGADGVNSVVGQTFGLEYRVFKGAEAIGITANLINKKTPEENHLTEFGLMSIYNRAFFQGLKEKFDLELENLVYYREETHYLVFTVKRESLIKKNVVYEKFDKIEELIQSSNINQKNLEKLVREVADYVGLPSSCPFVQEGNRTDVNIFDFSKKRAVSEPSKIVYASKNKDNPFLIALAGDALVEPFWPQGTGANRAILSALDTAWQVKCYVTGVGESTVVEARQKINKFMATSDPEHLFSSFANWKLSPSTRYRGVSSSSRSYSQQASS